MQLQHRRTEEPVAESTGQTHSCYSTTADAQRTEEQRSTAAGTEQHSRTPPLLLHSRGGKEATKKNPGGQQQSRSSFTGSRWPRGRRSNVRRNGGRAARGQAATSGRRTTDGCCNRQKTGGERRAANGRRDRQIRDGRPQKKRAETPRAVDPRRWTAGDRRNNGSWWDEVTTLTLP